MKIIILKRDKLGDLLLTTPMLQMLKQALPKSKIAVMAPESSSWILNDAPFVDEIYSYAQPRLFKLKSIFAIFNQLYILLKIRRENYDFAIAAGGEYSHRAVKRLLWLNAKKTISFVPKNKEIRGITYAIPEINFKEKKSHETERMIKLLNPIVKFNKKLIAPSVYFNPPQDWIKKAKSFLVEHHLENKKYIVFGLGARREKKQPSEEQIIFTARYIYKKYKMKTVLVWTPGSKNNRSYPGDDEIAYKILKKQKIEIIPLRAPLDLTIGVIWLARKSIFPDSGLMHFAAASPGGVIGLFAETNISPHPKQWGPVGKKSVYISAKKTIKELGANFLNQKLSSL